jgi:hypothetical protein
MRSIPRIAPLASWIRGMSPGIAPGSGAGRLKPMTGLNLGKGLMKWNDSALTTGKLRPMKQGNPIGGEAP